MRTVRPAAASQSRVSWWTRSPEARTSACRFASCSSAFATKRIEFRFLISTRVPKGASSESRTDTFASHRMFPFSVSASDTPV